MAEPTTRALDNLTSVSHASRFLGSCVPPGLSKSSKELCKEVCLACQVGKSPPSSWGALNPSCRHDLSKGWWRHDLLNLD